MSRLLPAVLAALSLLLAPGVAAADGTRLPPVAVPATDLADAAGAVAPSAASGHVVFSRLLPATQRFELVAWTAARGLRVLPVGTRAVPFDADVGPTATGGVAVVYSRCAGDGVLAGILPAAEFTDARGCRLELLDLDRTAARPRRLTLAGAAGLSLTTPSLRGRSVAAVAAPGRGSGNARILLWSASTRAPVRLHGGSAPTCPYRSCKDLPRSGVDALDLGPRSVAFTWRLTQPDVGAGSGVELRTSSLRPNGFARRIGSAQGYVSGACGFREPLSPNAGGGGGVAFLLAQSPCDELQTSLQVQRAGASAVLGARPAGVLAYGAAYDGSHVYWLRGTPPHASDGRPPSADVPCAQAATACRLVRSDALPLSRAAGRG